MNKEELLHSYFQEELSAEDLEVFTTLLAEDAEFKEQFRFEKNLQMAIKNKERNHLKKKLQHFEEQHATDSLKNTRFFSPTKIAAAIIVLLAIGGIIFTIIDQPNTDKLYTINYEKYPNTVYAITRGSDSENTLVRKAFIAYEANDIDTAIAYFEKLKQNTDLSYVDFYLAQCYLANGAIEKAVSLFEQVANKNTDFKMEALWYAALGNIKNEEKVKAKQQLEALVLAGTYKKQLAIELLEDLE
ncbi:MULTISPECIES: tetratricopeptide repeat protein [Cellulophaga]|uniref:tetratricopeptide repeat protein n=1 Tax=Cellulophaga TaxID=104264 RepID=UPI00051DA9D2|nr:MULTISPECIES: tetratricopeptide repeat protein [Cellulophaga]KGK28721.1 hypothetical protein EL45_19330 [Cellulophaga sp. E6(2014)]